MTGTPTKESWEEALKHEGLIRNCISAFMAKSPFPFKVDREDLFQVGLLATERAARGFNPELGFQFSTYAARAIREALWHEAHNQQNGKPRGKMIQPRGVSIDAVDSGGNAEGDGGHDGLPAFLNDAIGTTQSSEDEFFASTFVRDLIDELEAEAAPSRRRIYHRLRQHYLEDRRFQEIADEEGISKQAVVQSVGLALQKLRARLTDQEVAA